MLVEVPVLVEASARSTPDRSIQGLSTPDGSTPDGSVPDGGPSAQRLATLGLLGSLAIAVSGLVVGALPIDDPLTGLAVIRGWRAHPTSAIVLGYVGMAALVVAWLRLAAPVADRAVPGGFLLRTACAWAAPLALTYPLYSRDIYSYLAQGAMWGAGLDPYRSGPAAIGGELAAGVSPIWQHAAAPYGPVFLAVVGCVMSVAGDRVIAGILLIRIVSLVSLFGAVRCLPRLARAGGVDVRRAFWLGALNPLVLAHLVAGGHNDVLMLSLLLGGMVCGVRGRLWAAGVLIGLAALVKVPALIALPFLVMAGRRPWRAAGVLGVTSAGVVVAVTAATDSWYGWVTAIGGTARVHNGLSVTTDLGDALAFVLGRAGWSSAVDPVAVTRGIGVIAGTAVAVVLLMRCRDRPVLAIGLGLAALVALGPVVHPWYLLWAVLPLAASIRRRSLVRAVTVVSALAAFYPSPSGGGPTGNVIAGLVAAAGAGYLLWWLTGQPGHRLAGRLVAR